MSLSGWASGVGEDFVAFPSGVFVRFVVLISEGRQGRAQVELKWSGAWVGVEFFLASPLDLMSKSSRGEVGRGTILSSEFHVGYPSANFSSRICVCLCEVIIMN